jgi:hypothetical protein
METTEKKPRKYFRKTIISYLRDLMETNKKALDEYVADKVLALDSYTMMKYKYKLHFVLEQAIFIKKEFNVDIFTDEEIQSVLESLKKP